MSGQYNGDPMLEMYIFETTQNLEQLEAVILSCEHTGSYSPQAVNEIFRIVHTVKGSSAMMLFGSIASLAHNVEDLFHYLREKNPLDVDSSQLTDLVLHSLDFIKLELQKIKAGDDVDGDSSQLVHGIQELLSQLQQGKQLQPRTSQEKPHFYIAPAKRPASSATGKAYRATLQFEDDCQMENIRAYLLVHNLQEMTDQVYYQPEDIIDNDESAEVIRQQGFTVYLKVDKSFDEMHRFFTQTLFLKDLQLTELDPAVEIQQLAGPSVRASQQSEQQAAALRELQRSYVETASPTLALNQSLISVNVSKLDKLMDLVGEMVIAEAMVIQNPDLKGLNLENFSKAARQLNKITGELQNTVMSIRMVPLAATFHKMHRVTRDMCKKLGKDVKLRLLGEDTEVDKNIIEHISDPLMHLIRNAIDHGIENMDERAVLGKPTSGTITLEAKNAGSDVIVRISDDGRGLSKEKILKRARENGLIHHTDIELTDKDIYGLIYLPGFSTKDSVSEFSGRGVGMDVVTRHLSSIGGVVAIDSTAGVGTTVTLKIPLTLAIIDGMNVRVGTASYTIPITTIKQSFRPMHTDLVVDPDGNEMVMVRGQCYPIVRLHRYFSVNTTVTNLTEGILVMVEQDKKTICVFADALTGQQQVVIKPLPSYIKNIKQIGGLAGCTILGDGCISLILNVNGVTA